MGAACRRPSYVEGMRLRRRFCCSVLIAGAATLGPLAAPTIGASAPCDAPGTERVDLTTADGVSVAGFVQGDGPLGVVLVHQVNQDHCGWKS